MLSTMLTKISRVAGVALTSTALALALGACTTPSAPAPAAPPASSAPASSAPAGGSLDFATVEKITAPALQKDPNCPYGQWNENSTGVDEEFRTGVKFFRQFDCYENKESVAGGLPKRGQQSMYVEFGDEATADKYAESQRTLYSSIVAGNVVVVTGTGLESVDMTAYLNELKTACGCGEIVESGT